MSLRYPVIGALALAFALAGTLPAMAGTLMQVEVDWLEAAGHSHKPSQCELDAVSNAFSNHGITLVFELGDAIPETAANQVIDYHYDEPGGARFDSTAGEWFDVESVYRDHAAGTGWHYCLFGHNYSIDGTATGSSGLAELPGDEFVVTMGSFTGGIGTPWDRTGTLMHEFGHNLNLQHSGDQDKGAVWKFKPNYASVMAYRYQLIGVRNGLRCEELGTASGTSGFRNLDYSEGTLGALDENALDECAGLGLGKGVDWNCNGMIQPPPGPPVPGCPGAAGLVAQDISTADCWCTASGPRSTLTDYDDWSNLTDVALLPPEEQPTPERSELCITAEEATELFAGCAFACTQPNPCDEPTLTEPTSWGNIKALFR